MQKKNFQKIILVSTLVLAQNYSYAQSISASFFNSKSNQSTPVTNSTKTTSASITTSGTASVSSVAVSNGMPIPLTTEVISYSESSVALADHALLVRLNELATLASQEGLLKKWYLNDVSITKLNTFVQQGSAVALTSEVSNIVKKICDDFYRGHITSEILSDKAKITSKKLPKSQLDNVKNFVSGGISSADLLASVRPKNFYYSKLVETFLRLTQVSEQGLFQKAPALAVVKPGIKNAALVIYARTLLNVLGYKNDITSGIYNDELNAVIKSFQTNQGLSADGSLGSQGWAWLNLSVDQLRTRLIINIDRARWLPDDLGSENVFVNLAMQKLKLTQNSETAMEFRTINGRIDRQTPMLFDRISFLMLNPTWTVPTSILIKDKLPVFIINHQKVLDLHMKMLDDATDTEIDPLTFDWSYYSQQYDACKVEIATGQSKKKVFPDDCRINIPHTFVQQPGSYNALGLIKFPLTNPYAIYMHDTDTRSKFNESSRLLSSGCVRLQKPFEFAEKLLNNPEQWSLDQLKQATELLPTPALESTRVNIGRSIPVYIFYFTTHLDDQGQLAFAQDAYGTDLMVLNLMNK